MAPTDVSEIKLEDIDFEVVKACDDKHVLKKYIKLLEEDGGFFIDLLKATRARLLEVSPKEYYLLYPRQASEQEVQDITRDLLDWEDSVKETDKALRDAKSSRIWDDAGGKVRAPVRGQEPTIARPSLANSKDEDKRAKPTEGSRDAYARDKTKMKDYYSSWDRVDVDAMEADIDREMREEEEARQKHFEDMKEQQDEAQATTPIDVASASPEAVPEAHRKHMADSEKEKGNEAFYAKDWEEAEAYYTRSINFKADDPSTWANRALVRLKLQRAQQALEDCEHSLALNARYMKALHRKGKALHELKRYEEAVKYFQLALAESPGNTQINGDLCVARRNLRGAAPPEEPPKPRRVDAPPSCTIEELEDDEGGAAAAAPPPAEPGYTRVQIEEDSEDEEEEEAAPTGPATSAGSGRPAAGFHKVAIEEVSGSEDEDEGQAPATAKFAPPPRAQAAPKPSTPQAAAAGRSEVSFDDMD